MKKKALNYRLYWNQPGLISRLPEEQRRKVVEKFFELVEKSKEENAKRNNKIIKERNERFPFSCR